MGYVAIGLVQGSLAALNALGIVMLWRTTRVVNLAQPAMGLVSGVLVGMLIQSGGWSFWWALPLGLALGGLLGLLADRAVLVRLQDVPRVVLLVATIGLAQIFAGIQAAIPFIFGGRLPTYTIDLGFSIDVFPYRLLGPHLLALIALPIVHFGVWYFLHRSRVGLAACAMGQDIERARTLGVPTPVVRSTVWVIAGMIAAVCGTLSIPVLGFSLDAGSGPTVLLLALAPAVLAGFKNLHYTTLWALAVSVAYQLCLTWVDSAGVADLLLAGIVIVAVASQRQKFGRETRAARASSWAAATTPRPLPWHVANSEAVKLLGYVAALIAFAAAVLPPVFLDPANDVLYATSAALALGAVGVACAWIFAGEIALGHWGLAGLGAAVFAIMPGPWPVRALVGGVLIAISGVPLALASRRQSSLAFAVLGLAAAAAAPVAVLAVGRGAVQSDPAIVGAVTGALCVGSAILLLKLRSSNLGAQMVAGRDDAQRAPWLGADPVRGRIIALVISAGLAGLAGCLYLSSTPAGIAPGAYDPQRSLDILAMAVVGGLGSPIGALLGAGTLEAVRQILPGPWATLASGAGVLVVVLFIPGGLSSFVDRIKYVVVGWVVGKEALSAHAQGRNAALSSRLPKGAVGAGSDGSGRRIAGSDTREAVATPTVRAAASAAALAAGVGWAAVFGLPNAWRDHVGWAPGPWGILLGIALFLGAALISERLGPVLVGSGKINPGIVSAGSLVVGCLFIWMSSDDQLGALGLVAAIVAVGWIVGIASRIAVRACVPGISSAAQGVVIASVLCGLIPAGHIGLVASGSGMGRAALWSAAYAIGAFWWIKRANELLPHDRRRVKVRVKAAENKKPSEGPTPALAFDGISVSFGEARVIKNATFSAFPGEMVALCGGNGAGKSTLLRIAAGLLPPDSGRILVNGEDYTTLRTEERAVGGLVFVSGARPVFPDLTVLENLRVAAFRSHILGGSFERATDAVLDLVPALAHRRHSTTGVLSGGEQRLLAIAQTLYRRPTALLADELTLGLDVEARYAALDLLRMLADDGVCVVVVDHDLPALLPRSDRAALITGGVIRITKTPTAILERRTDLLPATFLAGVNA